MASTKEGLAFTPGPWHLRDAEIVAHNGDLFICDPFHGSDRLLGKSLPIDQRSANARLIAAAPDLYEALKDLLADDSPVWPWANQVGIGKAEYDFRSAIVERARAALARVEG